VSDDIRVVVADGDELFREGAIRVLERAPGFEVVSSACDARDAVRLVCRHGPDVTLVGITLPGGGLNAARSITERCPGTRIVAFALTEQEDHVLDAFRSGARAYALKTASAHELRHVIRTVHAGGTYIPPSMATALIVEAIGESAVPAISALDALTRRERQVLEYAAAGASNREIGQQLYLAEKTVKHHMTSIMRKLGVRNRMEAALLARHDEGRRHAP
jgi:DNA-binding NarL/FixJ family response regulator